MNKSIVGHTSLLLLLSTAVLGACSSTDPNSTANKDAGTNDTTDASSGGSSTGGTGDGAGASSGTDNDASSNSGGGHTGGSSSDADSSSGGHTGGGSSDAGSNETGGNGGITGTGGEAGVGGSGGSDQDASTSNLDHFSFFVTSLAALVDLSGSSNGFGGDLRFGEATGLAGADKICATIAERSMPGSSAKQWRAFLSTTAGGMNNGPVNAIDRVGEGPWYDRLGRLFANNKTDLLQARPASADSAIQNDFPNEDGVPNHNPDGTGQVDNHDMLTGTNTSGEVYSMDPAFTCNDWTSSEGNGSPRVGHSWPRGGGGGGGGGGGPGGMGSGNNWMSALNEAGCAAGVNLVEMGGPNPNVPTVGSGGGYGGFYCFALEP